jgi:DNA-binding XRE family transcriptional regulator
MAGVRNAGLNGITKEKLKKDNDSLRIVLSNSKFIKIGKLPDKVTKSILYKDNCKLHADYVEYVYLKSIFDYTFGPIDIAEQSRKLMMAAAEKRKAYGIKVNDVANYCNCSRQNIFNIEKGNYEGSFTIVMKYLNALEVLKFKEGE